MFSNKDSEERDRTGKDGRGNLVLKSFTPGEDTVVMDPEKHPFLSAKDSV